MGLRFSIITLSSNYSDEEQEIFVSGWIELEELEELESVVDFVNSIPTFYTVHITIEQCLWTYISCNEEDMPEGILDSFIEAFDAYQDAGYIYVKYECSANIDGQAEDQIIEG